MHSCEYKKCCIDWRNGSRTPPGASAGPPGFRLHSNAAQYGENGFKCIHVNHQTDLWFNSGSGDDDFLSFTFWKRNRMLWWLGGFSAEIPPVPVIDALPHTLAMFEVGATWKTELAHSHHRSLIDYYKQHFQCLNCRVR